ncbi:MAG: hypothetical protein P4L73_14890 [Caulobacteraceae bacterium]|nr:hypothetical protein [Caulobacteraceae bacterium]
MGDKTLGILTYIDATANMLEDFSWLYKSWIYSGNWRTSDLIVCCNPAVIDQIPDDSGIVRLPIAPLSVPGSRWRDYPFINSIACLSGPHTDALADRYTHFLRTDADVFLTSNLVNFRPNVAVHGRGRYAERADVRVKMAAFAERNGLQHHGVFNCGHSLLSNSQAVLFFLKEQLKLCELLLEEFRDDPGQWPGWCRNVLTMYAAELVANHYWVDFLRLGFHNVLDYETVLWSDIIQSHVVHIHAVHVIGEHWSKIDHRNGVYADYDVSDLDITKVHDYCHWIAITPVDEIKALAGYPE